MYTVIMHYNLYFNVGNLEHRLYHHALLPALEWILKLSLFFSLIYTDYRIFGEMKVSKEKKLLIVPLPRDISVSTLCISFVFSSLHIWCMFVVLLWSYCISILYPFPKAQAISSVFPNVWWHNNPPGGFTIVFLKHLLV